MIRSSFFLLVSLLCVCAIGMERSLSRDPAKISTDYENDCSHNDEENSDDEYDTAQEDDVDCFDQDYFNKIALEKDKYVNVRQYEFEPTSQQKKLFKRLLRIAPQTLRGIYNQLKFRPELYSFTPKFIYITGKVGTGKTTLAQALACNIGRCFFVPVSEVIEPNGAVKLRKILNSILSLDGKKCVVLDDLNAIVENCHCNYENRLSASVLRQFIDKIERKGNILIIGTGEVKTLEAGLLSRLNQNIVETLSD